MNKLFIVFIIAGIITLPAKAQIQPVAVATAQPYGKVDQADLEMKTCDFEKDANAEILFDKGKIYTEGNLGFLERHLRIKVFNDFGKSAGNLKLEFVSYGGLNTINDLQGETINLESGKIEVTPIDKKELYTEKTDRINSTLIFAFPKVKAGSILEVKYRYVLTNGYFPTWNFQSNFPTRYSEIKLDLPSVVGAQTIRVVQHIRQPLVVDIGKPDDFTQVKALANVHSLPNEPYMGGRSDNLQRIEYLYTGSLHSTWERIGDASLRINQFAEQFGMGVTGDADIVKKAKSIQSVDERIAFIFDTVKNNMKWNGLQQFYINDPVGRAWEKKTGNSAEINIILYNLLKKAGINALPMLVSTRKHGKINPVYPTGNLFNNTVVFVPLDSTKYYVLDATNRYNLFNTVPTDELNTFGLSVDDIHKKFAMVFLEHEGPVVQSVFLNAEITQNGKMNGTAEITSDYYNKINALDKYKTEGEEKYIKYLCNDDKTIRVSGFKMEGMNVDSIPLSQKFNFSADLSGSDENYIYFNTSLFTLMGSNPFVNENRYSEIDFGYLDNYAINGIYKIPQGYKTEALPKNVNVVMPDQSITFKRIVAQENGTISIRYVLNHKKIFYSINDYQALKGFYQKLYELLNEQIVIKKA